MKKNGLLCLAAGLTVIFTQNAFASAGALDYAREQKWADEVVPGLVVGDPKIEGVRPLPYTYASI